LLPLATILGHPLCREEVLKTPFPPYPGAWSAVEWGNLEPTPPFVTFEGQLTVWVDDLRVELHCVGTPAHTTNDVVAWIPERSVLFSGDLVFVGGTPFIAMGSVSGAIAALDWLRQFGAKTLVPGHGPVSTPAAIDDVQEYLRFIQDTARRGKQAGLAPLELARQTDLGRFSELTDAELLAHHLGGFGERLQLHARNRAGERLHAAVRRQVDTLGWHDGDHLADTLGDLLRRLDH